MVGYIGSAAGPRTATAREPRARHRDGSALSAAFFAGLTLTLTVLGTVAAVIGRPAYGAALSLAFGVGRGLPFLAVGVFAQRAGAWLEGVDRTRRVVEVVSGLVLVGLSFYFVRLAVRS